MKERIKSPNINIDAYSMPRNISSLCGIRKKKDLILLLLNSITQLNNSDLLETRNANEKNSFAIVTGDINRLFYNIEGSKIITFVIPFLVRRENLKYQVYDRVTHILIDSTIISPLITALNDDAFDPESYDPDKSIEDLILPAIDRLEENTIQDYQEIWSILQTLFLFEPGYIRYDFDSIHNKGKMHPLNHYDVNYTNMASFKMGLQNKTKIKDIINFINKKTETFFLE